MYHRRHRMLWTIVCLFVLIPTAASFTSPRTMILIPSQIIRSSNDLPTLAKTNKNQSRSHQQGTTQKKGTVQGRRSQVNVVSPSLIDAEKDEITVRGDAVDVDGANTVSDHNIILDATKRRRRRQRPQKKKKKKSSAAKADTRMMTFGNQPDIYWRSIPLEHLRQHPRFRPLPDRVTVLTDLEDVRLFRQESWQWDMLHRGRCTTSQAAAALGFLGPTVGQVLNVPPSWRNGGYLAFLRLRHEPLRTLEEMNQVLCNCNDGVQQSSPARRPVSTKEPLPMPDLWSESHSDGEDVKADRNFLASYNYQLSEHEWQDRKKQARKFSENYELSRSIRMMWGNTQEATALLSALNFFGKSDSGIVLEEVGMCGAGLDLNHTDQSSLLVGATPDGVLRYPDGRIEALEVKNHCPFYSHQTKKKHLSGKMKRFNLSSMPLDAATETGGGVFAHYVPQLQMEMLCLGPDCRSAVMVRQTATAGALVLRMHRDDEWLAEMVYWLHRFHLDFVEKDIPPPNDFFWNSSHEDDRARYRRFIDKTNEIRGTKVEVLGLVPNEEIQRMQGNDPLFLD